MPRTATFAVALTAFALAGCLGDRARSGTLGAPGRADADIADVAEGEVGPRGFDADAEAPDASNDAEAPEDVEVASDAEVPEVADAGGESDAAGCVPSPDAADGATLVSPIVVAEGDEVVAPTTLHLSTVSWCGLEKVEWTVEQPEGSVSRFRVSAFDPAPSFDVNVVGIYVFRLRVWIDGWGPSEPTEAIVRANPGDTVHIELVWDTPDDPDQSDEGPDAGTDLDLHFAHPFASVEDKDGDGVLDPWFDLLFDVFWKNPAPNWANLDPTVDDDPKLARDDTDGAGPEVITVQALDPGDYAIGVHVWDDHGHGSSTATVRVFVLGELLYEESGLPMSTNDLWDVATLVWPAGVLVPTEAADGGPKVLSDYDSPW